MFQFSRPDRDSDETPADYLRRIRRTVANHRGCSFSPNPRLTYIWGSLDDTIYWGRKDLLHMWERFYLPVPTRMVVLGVTESFHSLAPGNQMILLLGENGKIYVYEEELMHLFARSLADLGRGRVYFPGLEIFECGRGIRPRTNEEYQQALKAAGLEKISPETRQFLRKSVAELKEVLADLEFL